MKHTAIYSLAFGLGIGLLTAGCSAPVGPLGGSQFNHALMNQCKCFSSGTCEDNDPAIVPPHANFNPLPTRPVFSPPAAIPGIYNPWPDPNLMPMPSSQPTPAPATEVQSPKQGATPASCSSTSSLGPDPVSDGFTLRR